MAKRYNIKHYSDFGELYLAIVEPRIKDGEEHNHQNRAKHSSQARSKLLSYWTKISDDELERVNLRRSHFQGNWNYSILPNLNLEG